MSTLLGLEEVRAMVSAAAPELGDRLLGGVDLAGLIERNQVPQQTPAAFVLFGGLQGGKADAATGFYRQEYQKRVVVVLAERHAGDARGDKALETLSPLVERVILAVAGRVPEADAMGVFTLVSAELVGLKQGVVMTEIEFALVDQLRITVP